MCRIIYFKRIRNEYKILCRQNDNQLSQITRITNLHFTHSLTCNKHITIQSTLTPNTLRCIYSIYPNPSFRNVSAKKKRINCMLTHSFGRFVAIEYERTPQWVMLAIRHSVPKYIPPIYTHPPSTTSYLPHRKSTHTLTECTYICRRNARQPFISPQNIC